MVMTDPIADFLTRVRNANMVKHESLEVPNFKNQTWYRWNREGFVRDANTLKMTNKAWSAYFLNTVKTVNGTPNLKRISKPALRAYVKADEVPKVLNGLGIAIISTSDGNHWQRS